MVGPNSIISIATCYGMDSPVIKSQWEQDFSHPSRLALGTIQPPRQWVPDLSWGQSRWGMVLTTHRHLAPRIKKKLSYTATPPLGLHSLF